MNESLPSLNQLRAFEAAARLGSFAAAGAELHVTPSAISQQIRLLEAQLGISLFRRLANGLELTEQARAYQPGLYSAFEAIGRLTAEVQAMRDTPVLTVGVAPALAMQWLIPRLTGFYEAHPKVEIRIATGGLMTPMRDDWTCTIRRGTGKWAGYVAQELFPSTLVAVCTGGLARRLHKSADLRKVPHIIVAHLRDQWRWWFDAVRAEPVAGLREAVFGSSVMALQAALNGVGVLVTQLPYVADALEAGRLVAPLGVPAVRYEGWYLAYRAAHAEDPVLRTFQDWLHRECVPQKA